MCEAIIDPGSARTIIDENTAKRMRLPIQLADDRVTYGSYWGPSGPASNYHGRIKMDGLKIEFGPGLYVFVDEIKVIKSEEALLLIGNDVLANNSGKWKFVSLGMHPRKGIGNMVFAGKRDTFTV